MIDNIQVTKPFAGYRYYGDYSQIPCWFFDGVEVPDIDYDELNWTCNQGGLLQQGKNYSLRYTADSFSNRDNAIIDTLKNLTNNIILYIKENHSIKNLESMYPCTPWKLSNNIEIRKDLEGFRMGRHLDNRNSKWTFILNLNDHNESTIFFNHNFAEPYKSKPPTMAPTKKGSGSFYFNHHTLIHDIGPITSKERYTLFQQYFFTP